MLMDKLCSLSKMRWIGWEVVGLVCFKGFQVYATNMDVILNNWGRKFSEEILIFEC